jgi:multicomponent Na+:H+ antiporter subunit E
MTDPINAVGINPHNMAAVARSVSARAVGFCLLWSVLSGGGLVDLVPMVVAALAAAGVSIALVPASNGRVRADALAELVFRLPGQSMIAGVDAARRALDPGLPLNPGFVRYRAGLPCGPARNTFTTLMSVLPGTVPTGTDNNDALVIHCLDVGQPVAAQLAAEEARLARVIGRAPDDG